MPATRRTTRRARQTGDSTVQELSDLVTALIRENRRLQSQVAKLSQRATDGTAARGLNAMRRRIERALGAATPRRATSASRRTSPASARLSVKTRRPASPEVRQKRLAALAKAREARAAKRAAAAN